MAAQGRSANENGCARISMLARSTAPQRAGSMSERPTLQSQTPLATHGRSIHWVDCVEKLGSALRSCKLRRIGQICLEQNQRVSSVLKQRLGPKIPGNADLPSFSTISVKVGPKLPPRGVRLQ